MAGRGWISVVSGKCVRGGGSALLKPDKDRDAAYSRLEIPQTLPVPLRSQQMFIFLAGCREATVDVSKL